MKKVKRSLVTMIFVPIILLAMPLFAQYGAMDLSTKVNEEKVLNSGWTQFEVPRVLTIEIPPTMEVASGAYRAVKNEIAKVVLNSNLGLQSLVFQQASLNDFNRNAMRRYARILISAKTNREFAKLISQDSLEPDLLKQIEEEVYSSFNDGVASSGIGAYKPKVIKWYPIEEARLGGLNGYKISLIRQLGTSPAVYVEEYTLGCGSLVYSVTFSYRKNEEGFWKADYDKIKRNLKFTKRY